MKQSFKHCEDCGEETIHSIRKVFSAKKRKMRREVIKCNECGMRIINNTKNGRRVV